MKLNKLNTRFLDKTAFITGAASGLGAAFAKLLAENGWKLHLTDINFEALQAFRSSLPDADSVLIYPLDVSNKTALEMLSADLKLHDHKLDLLINNAGIGDGEFFRQYKLESWERMIQINLMGVYYCTHFLLPLMSHPNGGLIINIASAAGIMNAPGMSAYNVSKAAVYSFSETLYHELKSEGIHVSVVTPTFFKTNIMSQAEGSEKFVRFAEKQMKHSTTNADEMAEIVLKKAAAGRFQIVHPFEAKKSFFLKRWFPSLIGSMYQKMMVRFKG